MKQLRVVDHPLVEHHLTRLRDVATSPAEFRRVASCLTGLLAYEATRDLATRGQSVQTPLCEAHGATLESTIGLVPVLRAGLLMVEPLLELIPTAEVWHLGIFRDEATATPVDYYNKLPEKNPVDQALVLDPMLATGGTVRMVIQRLQAWQVPRIRVLSLLAAPEGVTALSHEFPDVEIHACAVDNHLNDQKYIVPGLGDAGDRAFNTQR